MTFPQRKNRPGRYWKGRMSPGTVLESSEKAMHSLEPEFIEAEEPLASGSPASIEDPVMNNSPAAAVAINEPVVDRLSSSSEPIIPGKPPVPNREAELADRMAANGGAITKDGLPQPAKDRKRVEANAPVPAADPLPPRPRAVGAPLPRGAASRSASFEMTVPPPARRRTLPPPAARPEAEEERSSGTQRAAKFLGAAVPLVQRLLPLLEGNVVGAVTNILAPQHKPAPPVDLTPVQDALTELQLQHRELRDQVAEQSTTIRRVEDQLERVREATDRNTLEQQELMEDLRAVGFKANVVALVALALLLISLFLSLFLYLHFQRVFP